MVKDCTTCKHDEWDGGSGIPCCRCEQPKNGIPTMYETRPMTNAQATRLMTDEELADFICSMVDGSNTHGVGCYDCIYYGTHHSDPLNKGTGLYKCEGCSCEGVGLDVMKWLQQPYEGE